MDEPSESSLEDSEPELVLFWSASDISYDISEPLSPPDQFAGGGGGGGGPLVGCARRA